MASMTADDWTDSSGISQGAPGTICVAGRIFFSINRLTVLRFALSRSAACSNVSIAGGPWHELHAGRSNLCRRV